MKGLVSLNVSNDMRIRKAWFGNGWCTIEMVYVVVLLEMWFDI